MNKPAVNANASVRVEMEQLAKLSPEQSTAFLVGCGAVIAASKHAEPTCPRCGRKREPEQVSLREPLCKMCWLAVCGPSEIDLYVI